MIPQVFLCPICGSVLEVEGNRFRCRGDQGKQHDYDLASSGYVNLLSPGKKNNAKTGDSKEMIRARSAFLAMGHYQQAADFLCELIAACMPGQDALLVDAGCGEGYYTLQAHRRCPVGAVIGLDASKYAVEAASKAAKRQMVQESAFFAAANLFDMPLMDACADVVLNLFAPQASAEFCRVLKPGGTLMIGSAGEYHLIELKQLLYGEKAYLNERISPSQGACEIQGMTWLKNEQVRYSCVLGSADELMQLFSMTPYVHRTSKENREKLNQVQSLALTVDFHFQLYQKQ